MGESWKENTHACGERISNALRSIYPRATAKLVSRDTGLPIRTLERLLDGTSLPSFDSFVRLLAIYPQLLAALGAVWTWAPVATAAVEQAQMEVALGESRAKRQRAVDAMRGCR